MDAALRHRLRDRAAPPRSGAFTVMRSSAKSVLSTRTSACGFVDADLRARERMTARL